MHPRMFKRPAEDGSVDKEGNPIMWDWVQVPITKASERGKEQVVEICLNRIDDDSMSQWIWEGAKKHANSSMTNIVGKKTEASKAKAMEIAEANVQKAYEGKVRITGGRTKSGGKSQEVKVLAVRKAKTKIKAQAKRSGKVLSTIKDSLWTKLANQYLEMPESADTWEEAEKEIAALETSEIKGIDMSQIVADPELVKKAEARKAERKKGKLDEGELLAAVAQQSKAKQQPSARH